MISDGSNNPLRYRVYVYDDETNLYYLQSRYYDPALGRFINADNVALLGADGTLTGYNLFAYCDNNPASKSDPSGQIPEFIVYIGVLAVAALSNVANAIYYEFSDGKSDVTPDTYQREHVTRWKRLDYTKQQTGEEHYNINAWRFHSEYSLHEYGWYITKWAYKKEVPLISEAATHFKEADVLPHEWDIGIVNIFIVLWGVTGI